MNPSTSGWVAKFGHILERQSHHLLAGTALFNSLKSLGFLYGSSIAIPSFINTEHKASSDEKTKINFLFSLYNTYKESYKDTPYNAFIKEVLNFYKKLNIDNKSLYDQIIGQGNNEDALEGIINKRVFIETNLINKTIGNFLLNPYLAFDYLGFKRFLQDPSSFKNYIGLLEISGEKLIKKSSLLFTPEDNKLALFKKARLIKEDTDTKPEVLALNGEETAYLLCLSATLSLPYKNLQALHNSYINETASELFTTTASVENALKDLEHFVETYKDHIPGLKTMAMGEQLYENFTLLVNKLILRNSKRLLKEIKGSQELIILLTKSTHSELSKEERKKVQEQLLDIFKSIPSLAIFILPGGAILLPIFIKLIPKLLPSAFDDNRLP